jgi:acylaminoacyl-peptidase
LATNHLNASEIWVRDTERTRKVTSFNDRFFEKLDLSMPEKFVFKASDGIPIECWFYQNMDQKNERGPLMLLIKGGPHMACWGNAFNLQAQILASNGYSVLLTNERGTGGYGEEFARTAMAKYYGQREYQDIMEAVDYVLKHYPVDEERLNVMGYSRGGFLTNWIVTHTDRFRSAITAGGFSNVYSFYSTGDNIHVWCEKNYEDVPWNNEELYMSKSPIRYVKNVTTPTLIMHAMEDYRSSVTQAEQLYVSLKRLRKDTELILFPGENHSLPRASSPQHMIEYHRHVLRWLDKYNR